MSKLPKVLLWDIECSDLSGNFGFIFCIGYKWLGEKKVHLISIRDFKEAFKRDVTNDSKVITAFRDVLMEADLQVTHYGMRFDFPMIQTRCMMNGLNPMPHIPHVDTWRIARFKLKFNSNRLDTLSRAIYYTDEKEREFKTPIDGKHWVRAKAGYCDSIKYIEEHCVADIKVLEKVYLELRKYAGGEIPNLAKTGGALDAGCPACGSLIFQLRGYRLTAQGNKRKACCTACRHWFTLPLRIKE